MDTVFFSAARTSLGGLLDRVSRDKSPVEIVRRDKPSVIVMDKDEYEGLQETLHLLSSPRNAERLMRSINTLKAGSDVIEFDPSTDRLS